MSRQLILKMEEKYQDYLHDESKLAGKAESISFPESEEDIIEVISAMAECDLQITIQGGKTGIVGAAVPLYGHILNMSKMDRIIGFVKTGDGKNLLKVQPGITLMELKKAIKRLNVKKELFWPPNPTEPTATLGGIAACDAKGINTCLYGDTRDYIEGARIVRADRTVMEIVRGAERVQLNGREIDLLDLFIGGEGLFGVISELTLTLVPKYSEEWGICFFFDDKADVFSFAEELKKLELKQDGACIAAAEYIDRTAIDLIEERKPVMTTIKHLPDVDKAAAAMVYIELHGTGEEAIEIQAEALMELAVEHNSDPDRAWAVSGESEIEKLRAFRHAAPESVNLLIEAIRQKHEGVTKLSTDMSLEVTTFEEAVAKYEKDIDEQGLRACIFGHIFENHLHVNILPGSFEEYKKGLDLIEKWAREVSECHGQIVTEHGVGKLKKSIFLKNTPVEYINEIKKLKNAYDPSGLWNPGNML